MIAVFALALLGALAACAQPPASGPAWSNVTAQGDAPRHVCGPRGCATVSVEHWPGLMTIIRSDGDTGALSAREWTPW